VPLGLSQWIATAYMMTIVATVLIFGTLAGRIGVSRLFIAGLAVFVIGSFACGLSGSLYPLIAARILQGLGAAMMMSISMAIVMQVFPADERGRAMGYITATVALGLIIGPALGGILVDSFGWPFIFFVNVPIGCALLVLAFRYLRVPSVPAGPARIDYPRRRPPHLRYDSGRVPLKRARKPTGRSPPVRSSAGAGIAALVLFVYREKTTDEPLIDLSLVTTRAFVLPAASLVLYFTATLF